MTTKLLLFICTFIVATTAAAQTSAITSNGDEVVLYDNGTWKFVKKADSATAVIDTNKTAFAKNKEASFLLKSNIAKYGVNLDPQKWNFKKAVINQEAEYSFQLKGKDAYGMLISERIEIPVETLKTLAVENARNVAPDIKVVHEEYRMVNGLKVFCMQMNGTTKGIKFTYFGYYFSSEKGTAQFVTYTSQGLFTEYRQEMEDLLNGFVTTE